MPKLPRISGQKCIKVLNKVGFYVVRQRGSHILLHRDVPFSEIIIPNHEELDRGTLHSILRRVGLSITEFIALLKGRKRKSS
ncbi:MAG: YcfA family protein [Promethearchaeota archaeon CR_4]|nr:MAG: YcfA family protein [Candidatus Lokiarchaeota archaeon CR_4]